MFNFFKKENTSGTLILSSSWKKKSFFDFFKVNGFILFSFILLVIFTFYIFTLTTSNSVEIKEKNSEQASNYNKLLEISDTLWYLNWLTIQKFDGKKVVKILNYLETLDIYSYKLDFDNNKQFFFVILKSIWEEKLSEIIKKWIDSGVLNYYKTNETIKVTEEGKVTITLIFN
jgi:hypothetical protein